MKEIEVAGRKIGLSHPCFIIAEVGVNHNGDIEVAKRLVDVAAEAGADAVKFQTFKTERLVTTDAPKAEYQRQTTGANESQFEMLRRLELSTGAQREIRNHCRQRGILFMSTPFDEGSADFLADLGVGVFKIPSGEITNLPFLAHVARKGKPMIVSTGMSNLDEVRAAVRAIEEVGNREVVLLHCVSNYPANPADANLRAMHTMAVEFDVPVGYSDHTPGIEVALAAVALGACVIEKHFTLDRTLPGPDHRASLEPVGLQALVAGVRTIELAMGNGAKQPAQSEHSNREVIRRSLAAASDIPRGTVLRPDMLQALRPASGVSPALIKQVIGRKVKRSLQAGQLIVWGDLE